MKKVLLAAALVGGMLTACTQKNNNNQNNESMNTTFFDKQSAASVERTLTQEWDKVFPLSEKVNHKKVTFETQYGLTLAADLYTPKDAEGKLAAIAVSGPFGAVKEQSSGLYAMKMAERGFAALAFDPSICGWGGIALNAAAADTRIKATVASTMYDMTRVSGNDYNDAFDNEQWRHRNRENLSKQRLVDPSAMAGGVLDTVPPQAPRFVHDYYDYYKTARGYHKRSGNSNDGWRVIGTQAYANSRFLYYINEIRSAVLVMHGADAHSRYFGEAAYHYMVEGKAEGYKFVGEPNPNPENKQLLIIPDASHCDLYDGGYEEKAGKGQPKNMIPWDKLADFFAQMK